MLLYLRLLTATLRRSGTRRRDLLWENLALRQQLAVYQRQTHRPRLRQRDRMFWTFLVRGWTGWRDALVFVQPETVIRWDRARWRRYWAGRSRGRHPGRPRIGADVRVWDHKTRIAARLPDREPERSSFRAPQARTLDPLLGEAGFV